MSPEQIHKTEMCHIPLICSALKRPSYQTKARFQHSGELGKFVMPLGSHLDIAISISTDGIADTHHISYVTLGHVGQTTLAGRRFGRCNSA